MMKRVSRWHVMKINAPSLSYSIIVFINLDQILTAFSVMPSYLTSMKGLFSSQTAWFKWEKS